MSNVIQFGSQGNTLPTNPADLQNLGVAAASMSQGDSVDLLRLMRDGTWVFGAENIEPEEGSMWAINPYSFQHGYIAWADGSIHGELMVPIMRALPPRGELGDAPEGWQEQISFQLQCVSGEDKGQTVAFKTTSVGGKRAAAKMASTIASQAAEDPEHVVPVVTLETDHYKHKTYGKIYTPVLAISKWVAIGDANDAAVDDDPTPEDTKPTGRQRSK